jgi:acid phosphatase type 7
MFSLFILFLYSANSDPIAQMGNWLGPNPVNNPYGDDSGGDGGLSTYRRYRAPSNGLGVFWYSFDHGSLHFIMLSSEHNYTAGSAQHTFLVNDLASVNRSLTPWLIVAMHRPVFNSMVDGDWTIDVAAAEILEPLLTAANVDLVLAGHYHTYLRTSSLYVNSTTGNITVDTTGNSPTYVTVGTGGATYHNESIRPDAEYWTERVDAEWGFGFIEIHNRTALRMTFRANADGGAIHDEFWLLRPSRA